MRPPGYRTTQGIKAESAKAFLVLYFGHELWVPRKSVHRARDGQGYVAGWAVDSAKDFNAQEAERRGAEEDTMYDAFEAHP